ncbi:hypothetical protein F4818DRAFT_309287 [Hypoxylon cercidicola]|nr:hypothetical protein F4818DRAFT_309287 [Hypoxylon cercidicola]
MDYGKDPRSPQRTQWVWRSSDRLTIGWWSVLVCFMAIFSASPLAAGENTSEKSHIEPEEMSSDETSKFIKGMDPCWHGCQEILLDTEPFESWFDGAETNTAAIATMLEAVPFSYDADKKGDASTAGRRTEAAACERKEDLAKAKKEFKGFLAIRKRIMQSVFSNRTLWHYYADGGQEVEELLGIADYFQGDLHSTNAKAVSKSASRQGAAWADAAERASRITTNLVQTHWDIWNYEGVGTAVVKHLAAAAKHVGDARSLESQAVWNLKTKSAKYDLWHLSSHGNFLLQLESKLKKTHKSSKDLMNSIKWAQKHVPIPTTDVQAPEDRAREWTMRSQRLLRSWAILIQVSHQGMLFFLRRNEFKAAGKKGLAHFDFDGSWEAWKTRNCGGTSCFDHDGLVHRTLRAFGVSYLPLARRARDEQNWCKKQSMRTRPFVWRGVYEDACCENGELAMFLKYGPMVATSTPRWTEE